MPIRIYYEDTDCGGVVYYANYLRYFERGRTEFLRDLGVSLPELHLKGIVFVVTKAEVQYMAPCKYGDLLILETLLAGASRATITFEHTVKIEGSGNAAIKGTVVLAAVDANGKPARLPEDLKTALGL